MKLGSVTNCMNEEDLIGGCLSLLDVDHKVVVLSKKSYMGKDIEHFDASEKIAKKHGAHVIWSESHNQSDMRNAGIEWLQQKGCDYAMIVDADEWYPKESIQKLKEHIENNQAAAYKTKLMHMFKRPNWHVPTPIDGGTLICLSTKERLEQHVRRDFHGGTVSFVKDLPVYHFSYVRTPEKILEKITNFSHASEVTPNWYEDVFLKATVDSHNVHPTNGPVWQDIKPIQLPQEIADLLPEKIKNL